MPLLTSIAAWCRSAEALMHRDRLDRRAGPDDLLTCLLAFSAVGLFASCLALAMQHETPHVAVLEFLLICVAPPLAAIVGLRMLCKR